MVEEEEAEEEEEEEEEEVVVSLWGQVQEWQGGSQAENTRSGLRTLRLATHLCKYTSHPGCIHPDWSMPAGKESRIKGSGMDVWYANRMMTESEDLGFRGSSNMV